MLLLSNFCIPFSLQLWKVEVINTYGAKFYIEIPTRKPVLNAMFSFAAPPLLDSKNGREPRGKLDLTVPRGIGRHTRIATWPAFQWPISLKEATSFYFSGSRAVFTTHTYCKHSKENSLWLFEHLWFRAMLR